MPLLVKLGDPRLGIGDVAPEPGDFGGKQRPRGHRGIAICLKRGDRFGGLPGQIFPAAFQGSGRANLQISNPGIGGVEASALVHHKGLIRVGLAHGARGRQR